MQGEGQGPSSKESGSTSISDCGPAPICDDYENIAQVHKGGTRDAPLVAVGNVERVDSAQMHKSRIRDGWLMAISHNQFLDPAQVHESRIRDG